MERLTHAALAAAIAAAIASGVALAAPAPRGPVPRAPTPDAPTPTAAPPRAQPEPYAVVVHPATSIEDVSLAQLRRVFLGEQQFWTGGARVVLFVQAPGTSERSVMLRRLYRMDETEFKRYWIQKTFRDDVASGPKIVSTSALARRLTAAIPGAVALIPLSAVDASVRVVRVDGRLPDDDGYPLTSGM